MPKERKTAISIVVIFVVLLVIPSILSGLPPQIKLMEAYADCVTYSNSTKTVRVTCNTDFAHLAYHVTDPLILENTGNGEYVLKANLRVDSPAKLVISSSDGVKWIKITADNGITVYGHIDIIGVKITSWDETINSVIDNGEASERAWFRGRIVDGANIKNSEMAYLGYNESSWKRGITFDGVGGQNVRITNSTFHHNWYAFYSNGLANSTIDSSEYYGNHMYAIDPHTGTHNLTIKNNHVHHNADNGIICSLDCYNILIEGNTVHDHASTGISLSRNTHNSTVLNNEIWNAPTGIAVSESPNNKIYNNTIYNVTRGIYFVNPPNPDDGVTENNYAYNNIIENAGNGIVAVRAPVNIVANNTMGNSISGYEYILSYDSRLIIENQHFDKDRIRGLYGNNTMTIHSPEAISINGGPAAKIITYTDYLESETILVSTVSSSRLPSEH